MFGYFGRETRKKWLWVLIPCLSVLFLQLIEYRLHSFSLELRTGMQILKGIYIWTAVPLFIVFRFYRLYTSGDGAKICRILTGILCVLIVGISCARLGLYLVSECKVEKWLEKDILLCTDYQDTWHQVVYEPVCGILRIPFRGWEEEEMLERLRGYYGDSIEMEETLEDGSCLFRADSGRRGVRPFYFQVKNNYWLTSNFDSQLMKSDASIFWKTRDRAVSLIGIGYADCDMLELSDEINGREYASGEKMRLDVYCASREDIPACAADLADWYLYVREEKRYLKDEMLPMNSPLACIRIHGAAEFYVEFNEMYGRLSQWLQEYSWVELKDSIEQKLQEQYDLHEPEDSLSFNADGVPADKEAWAAAFMESYDGESCEKECAVGDGAVRYRMVCIDAALGSRAYALLKSFDGGISWQVQEMDPFDGQWGMGIDFTFLTEEFGFASLMHNGGDEADLYVTEDGGRSYQPCVFQGVSAELEDGYYYQPYDYPQMPYEENGRLYVLCGQGMDGDYAGGDDAGKALFESPDHGYTFFYQGIQRGES